jgi:hypothetical protein
MVYVQRGGLKNSPTRKSCPVPKHQTIEGCGGRRYVAPHILTFSSRGKLLKNYTIRSLWTENEPLVFGMLDSKRQPQNGITPLLGHISAVQQILNLGRSVQLKFYLSMMFVWQQTLVRRSYIYRNLVVGDIGPPLYLRLPFFPPLWVLQEGTQT